jgi:agmatinase
MNFPNYFADAEADFTTADYVIFGVPYEHSSSFRHGAHKAPAEIRQASWNFETYDIRTHVDLKNIAIHDFGDLSVEQLTALEMKKTVSDFSKKIIAQKKFPIALGGDHSITPGIIYTLPKDTIIISLDAHLDYRDEYEDNPMNHACVTKRIADYLPPSQIYVIGIRSAENQEYISAHNDGVQILDAFTLYEKSFISEIKKLKHQLKNQPIYLTLDIDVIDPAYAPATSTPEPFGLKPIDLYTFFKVFSPNLIGMDLVEICPGYDHGQTALLGAKLLRVMIANHSITNKP